jgi:dolichol-phosphate mannosyltransferase
LYERLVATLSTLTANFEIILVDDCGPGDAWKVITDLLAKNRWVRGVRLSRNFGQHAAITAGLAESRGNWVVVMDCDLQDPPEDIPRLYERAMSGYDVVYAKRRQKKHSLFRRTAARIYSRSLNFFNKSAIEGAYGTFSIISKKVVRAFLELQDRDRHYLMILHWLGFRSSAIEYEHAPRLEGKSSYTLAALLRHAFDGLFFQTTILLRWIIYLGFWVSLVGLLLAAYFVYEYFVHSVYPGWTSLSVLILVIGGFIMVSTGITGLYIGKIFEQVKGRPLYVVDERMIGGAKE